MKSEKSTDRIKPCLATADRIQGNYGKNNNVDMYVVNYFKEIYYYNHKDDLGKRKKIYKNLHFKKLSSNKKKRDGEQIQKQMEKAFERKLYF